MARKVLVDVDATPDLLLLIQLCIVQYRYRYGSVSHVTAA